MKERIEERERGGKEKPSHEVKYCAPFEQLFLLFFFSGGRGKGKERRQECVGATAKPLLWLLKIKGREIPERKKCIGNRNFQTFVCM